MLDIRLRITNYELRITNYELRITNYELRKKSDIGLDTSAYIDFSFRKSVPVGF